MREEGEWERLLRRAFLENETGGLQARIKDAIDEAASERDLVWQGIGRADSVSQLIKVQRVRYGLEVGQLATLIGVDVTSISHLEDGSAPLWSVGASQLVSLAAYLGIPVKPLIDLVAVEQFHPSGIPVPVQTRSAVRRRAHRSAFALEASQRLEAKVWENRKQEFLDQLKTFSD